MGNSQTRHSQESSSSSRQRRSSKQPSPVTIAPVDIDHGSTLPYGSLYPSAPDDYDKNVLIQAILMNKLSPFYQGCEEPPLFPNSPQEEADEFPSQTPSLEHSRAPTAGEASGLDVSESSKAVSLSLPRHGSGGLQSQPPPRRSCSSQSSELVSNKRAFSSTFKSSSLRSARASHPGSQVNSPSLTSNEPNTLTHVPIPSISKRDLWKEALECPICFLYYPRNINYTKCCDQPICTDCFIQIKRPESTFEPACCPYCVVPEFGVTYDRFDTAGYKERYGIKEPIEVGENKESETAAPPPGRRSMNRKGNVFLSDELRPDWEKRKHQLALERSIQQRRLAMGQAQRARIPIFDDREISGAATAAAMLFEGISGLQQQSQTSNGRGSRSHRDQRRDFGYLQTMRHMGADIEELMMMEAIRQSMQEAEEQQRRQQEEEARLLAATQAEADRAPEPTQSSGEVYDNEDELLQTRKEGLIAEKIEEEQPISERLEELKLQVDGQASSSNSAEQLAVEGHEKTSQEVHADVTEQSVDSVA